MQLETPDVGASRRNGGGEVGVKSAAIRRLERQTHHELFAFQLLPVDLEPPLRLLNQHQQVRTVRAVNANSPASGYIPHNRIAGYGLTTLGVAYHQPIDALDADSLRRATDFVDEPIEGAGLWRLAFTVALRIQLPQHLRDVHVALANRRDEVIEVGEVKPLGDLREIRVLRLRQSAARDLPIEDFAAELDGGCVLLDTQALADLVTGAAGPDMRQAIATRLC